MHTVYTNDITKFGSKSRLMCSWQWLSKCISGNTEFNQEQFIQVKYNSKSCEHVHAVTISSCYLTN